MTGQPFPTSPRSARDPNDDDAYLPYFEQWQRDRDRRALDLLVRRYMPLARSLARRYVTAREPLEDLVQIASFGLMGAIDRFDTQRGVSFTSFAVPTILGELRRHLRDHGWSVHVPRSAQERAIAVENAIRELTTGARREPTVPDLAQHLSWPVEEVLEGLQVSAGRYSTSLDGPSDAQDEDRALAEQLGDEDEGYAAVDDRLNVNLAARGLPRHARTVVRLRFVEDLTQAEIAARTGMSQMQVSRILRESLERLRTSIDAD